MFAASIKGSHGERTDVTAKNMVLCALFASLTGASSLLAIPIGPVPVTLQTLFILAAGGILGPKWGPLSVCLYLAMGLAGLPVFAGGTSGLGRLLGPTGGYLVGFVLAASIVGYLAQRCTKLIPLILSTMVGLAGIYCLGASWLSVVGRITLEKALLVGVTPFVPGDLFKAFIAALAIKRWPGRIQPR